MNQQQFNYQKISSEEQEIVDSSLTSSKRINFVRKVFSIVTIQLILTTFLSYLAMKISSILVVFGFLFIPAIIGILVTSIWLHVSQSAHRTYPKNYILLSIFTICQSIVIATTCSMIQEENIVLQGLLLTSGIVISLTTYALTTKKDFTLLGGSFFLFMMSIMMLGLFSWIFRNNFLHTLYSVGGAMSFGIYLIYDVQLIMGDKIRKISIDDYILGSLMLYTDIIRIFMKVLKILQELNKKKD